MAAVLSLGAVGYGVAMMFLGFGAPDLAMTQFSVETLTVLIYVLVFRHFRGLGELSPRLVRARDGLIAAGIGIFIGGLLLSVATTETAPRLQGVLCRVRTDAWATGATSSTSSWSISGRSTRSARSRCWQPRRLAFVGCCDSPPTVAVDHEPVQPVNSPIFRTAARLLMPLLLLFSVFLLLRGHNEPGGGFVGGLVAAAAFALYAIAFGVQRARQALLVQPLTLLGAGLLIALLSGLPAVLRGEPFLTALWALRAGAARHARVVRCRRVSRRRGRGADDDLQPRGGVLDGGPAGARVRRAVRRRHLPDAAAPPRAAHHRPRFAVQRDESADLHRRRTHPSAARRSFPRAQQSLVQPYADPVPQALVLTAIVIGFGLLAFSLVLAHRVHATVGTDDVDDVGRER